MKTRLSFAETMTVGSMLFGLFFGAGNLIFPIFMGQSAGYNLWPAIIGFLITGVGIPLLGVAALGMSRSSGLLDMSSRAGRKYGLFFTCLSYLTIGPFFAIPRCASTSFSVGIKPMLPEEMSESAAIWIFSFLFFAAVLWFSLRPGKILTWIGKILTPLFLLSLALLAITALIRPIGSASTVIPQEAYQSRAFFKGFLEGYNTMDAIAGLAFGIVVVDSIKRLGVTDPDSIAGNTVRSGIFGCVIMGLIYIVLTLIGAQSRAVYDLCVDGGEALNLIAKHYFGDFGAVILAVIVTLACLKTAVGLITSCGEAFLSMFPNGPAYTVWAIGFCVVSFLIATMGLSAIIDCSLPVLMFLYPLSITLILLAMFGKFFDHDKTVYISTTVLTLIPALFDFVTNLPEWILSADQIERFLRFARAVLPFFDRGLGWVCPALIGFILGMVLHFIKKGKTRKAA